MGASHETEIKSQKALYLGKLRTQFANIDVNERIYVQTLKHMAFFAIKLHQSSSAAQGFPKSNLVVLFNWLANWK